MAIWFKQGDAFRLPVRVTLNGVALDAASVEKAEFCVGGVRKLYPGEVTLADKGLFYVPLTQKDTLTFPANDAVSIDVRVRFPGGDVLGTRKMLFAAVADAVSEEVL